MFQTFPKKETSIWQRMFVFWLMVFQALPRIVTLSLTLFFMDLYVFGYSLTVLGPMILILLVVIIPFYKINPQKAFVGAIASLFAPCIVLDDFKISFNHQYNNFSTLCLFICIEFAYYILQQ